MRVGRWPVMAWLGFALITGGALASPFPESPSEVSSNRASTARGVNLAVAPLAITPVVTATYAYDSLGRLIQETAGTRNSSFTYDAAGNRTQAAQ